MRLALASAFAFTAGAGLPTLGAAETAPVKPAVVSAAEKAAADAIRPEMLRAHVRLLAHDLLEGRGPASRGDRLAQLYIATQMEGLGLEPGAAGGGWSQPFDIVGMTSHGPDVVSFARGADKVDLRSFEDFIAFSGVNTPEARLDGAEIVFVGYGIVAPEYEWDDYKGADLEGKVLLMMNNDPESDPRLFAGRTRLYYGRWDYKYEQAAKVGAAGAIIIHTDASASYPWQVVQTSWAGEQFSLPDEGGPHLQVKSWATDAASRRIARLGGQDLDALRAAAEKRDFRPVPLGVTLSLALRNDVKKAQTANVIGRLPGRDPGVAREAVIYTAHHDHLGVKEGSKPGDDAIYNGARDNASGVAILLSVARAMKALPETPRRTVLFAAVAAEEQGLLGSKYLAAHPPVHPGLLAANINVDTASTIGRTRDITMIGLGKSNLDDWIKALAAMQGRRVEPDQFPEKGSFYRSDQFSLAKIGVPAAYLDGGTDVVGKPAGWGEKQEKKYNETDYHQPSDELRDDWDLSGTVEDAQLFFFLGVKVGNAARMPAWKPGDEFEAARKKAVAEAAKLPASKP